MVRSSAEGVSRFQSPGTEIEKSSNRLTTVTNAVAAVVSVGRSIEATDEAAGSDPCVVGDPTGPATDALGGAAAEQLASAAMATPAANSRA